MAGESPVPRFTGRTLDEALSRAASQLQASSKDNVSFRIVEERPGRLLVRPSVTIEAWIEADRSSEGPSEGKRSADITINGMSISIKPPSEGEETEPVTIWSTPPVKLHVSGVELRSGEAAEVVPGDIIVADIGVDQTPISEVHVSISEDGLTASIVLETKTAPRYELEYERTPRGYRILASEAGVNEPAPLTVDEVVETLRDRGVVYHINEEAIHRAIRGKTKEEVVVAEGKPAVPTVQDEVNYKFGTGIRRFDSDEAVDYHEFWVTPCVAAGDVIAEKIAGRQGEPGIKVTGEEIPADPYRPITLEAADGAEASENGTRVVATCSGRPVLANGKVGVNRIYELNRGVGLHTSNIHFDGDVFVKGDVNENMMVEATGNVDISGCGFECLLVAKQHVQVGKSLVSSHVVAGGSGGGLGTIYHGLRKVVPQLEKVLDSVRYLDESAQGDSARKDAVVRDLLGSRFRTLPSIAGDVFKHVESLGVDLQGDSGFRLQYVEFGVPEDINNIVKLLYTTLNKPDLVTWSHLSSVLETARQAVESLKAALTGDCVAKIGYCQSSVIEVDGDIQIMRQGSVNSTLRSGGSVNVAGVVRGGEVVCLNRLTAKEVGTIAGTKTDVQILDPQGSLKASVVHPNVSLTIGNLSYKFTDSYRLVEAKVSAQGAITVTSAGREI